MAGARVRLADAADREVVRTLRLRSLKDSPWAFGSTYGGVLEAERKNAGYWDGFLAVGPCFLVMPDGADGPVGLCRLMNVGPGPTTDGPAEIISVWVAPEARGTGAGRALIEACISWMDEHLPGEAVQLDVVETNAVARRLYERCGFEVVGPNPEDPDELVMERRAGRHRGDPLHV
jgi:ribosomal protein S18 acetylase RimI-like enzyme